MLEVNLAETRYSPRKASWPACRLLALMVAILPAVGAGSASWGNHADTTCGWASGFEVDDFDIGPRVSVVYDDGDGEALYAGGWFRTAGGTAVNHIAKWDGTAWSALRGSGGTGTDGAVYALAVYDDGTGEALYAGGWFRTAGGVEANLVAKWDGTAWSALTAPGGAGIDGQVVQALAVYDDGSGEALYAAGRLTTAGGITANRILKWDVSVLTTRRPAGDAPFHGGTLAWAVYDDGTGEALYAAGRFTAAGGIEVNHVARWDGTTWTTL
ncbi:MAG: hypothetical protein GY856_20355, partial [bacterium]|nr:hypothetical protein [bacterium]